MKKTTEAKEKETDLSEEKEEDRGDMSNNEEIEGGGGDQNITVPGGSDHKLGNATAEDKHKAADHGSAAPEDKHKAAGLVKYHKRPYGRDEDHSSQGRGSNAKRMKTYVTGRELRAGKEDRVLPLRKDEKKKTGPQKKKKVSLKVQNNVNKQQRLIRDWLLEPRGESGQPSEKNNVVENCDTKSTDILLNVNVGARAKADESSSYRLNLNLNSNVMDGGDSKKSSSCEEENENTIETPDTIANSNLEREKLELVEDEPSTSKEPTRKEERNKEKKRGRYVARALKTKLRERLEKERMVSLSDSSSDSTNHQENTGEEFEELDSSLLRDVIAMVEQEELNQVSPESPMSESSSSSTTNVDLDSAILNLLVNDKTYNTPIQMDDDIVREVARRTVNTAERGLS